MKQVSFRKCVAGFAAFCFFYNQVALYAQAVPSADPLQKYSQVQTVEEQEAEQSAAQVEVEAPKTALDFLSGDDAVLTPVKSSDTKEEEKKSEETKLAATEQTPAVTADNAGENKPGTFDQVLNYLNQAKGLAIRAVEKITYENLVELGRQTWEYGLAVVQGVILLFTSHEENSLSLTRAFGDLINKAASFVLHKQSVGQTYASLEDIEGAKERALARGEDRSEEYVISLNKDNQEQLDAVRFDNLDGNPDGQEVVAAGDLIGQIESYYDPAQSALQTVNEIIKASETEDPELIELWRSDPPTVFSGLPKLTSFASLSPAGTVSIDQASSSNYSITYDTSNGSFVGSVITWANTTAGFVDLSGLSKYSFEVKRNDTLCASVGVTCNFVEFKDTTGRVAKVRLTNIGTSFVQKDIPKTSLLSNNPNIDMTHIKEINFVFDSQAPSTGLMTINTGGLAFDPSLNPDGTNPSITTVPADPNGLRPTFTGFASNDFSSVTATMTSKTDGSLSIKQFNPTSFGGAFLNYDNLATTSVVEFINFDTSFPSGLVLELNDGGTGVSEVKLELTDNTNKKDFVRLKQIDSTGRRWKILASNFDEIDTTKIQSIAIVTEGQLINKTLNFSWGDFAYIPPVDFDNTNPAITQIPTDSQGNRPAFTGFASNDFSSVSNNQVSATFSTLTFTQFNPTSFGGAFLNYDNPATTTTVETISLNSAFPSGMVFQLDSPDGITSILLEVTDNTGKKDKVKLTNITTFGRKYKILASAFDEVDVTKIQSIAFVLEGVQNATHLNVDWGKFAFVPSKDFDNSNPAVTQVPVDSLGNRPTLTGFASTNNFNSVDVSMASPTFGTLTFNQYGGASFGGAFFAYDNAATTSTVEFVNFNTAFPSGMVLQLDSPDGIDSVIVEFTDNTGKKDKVKLTNITTFGRKYKFDGTEFDEIDITKIQTIALVLEGEHVNQHLNVDWGKFAFIPDKGFDNSNPAVTQVPVDSQGNRPNLTGFASTNNFNSVDVNMASPTFGTLTFNQYGGASFGGAFFAYDNPATTTTVETVSFNTAFPSGMVFQLDSPDGISSIIVEVTDNTGKKDKVRLTNITTFGRKYKFDGTEFDEIDITKIQTIAFVLEGEHVNQHLNVDWGKFAFIPNKGFDNTNPAVTTVPADSLGNRPTLTGFASTNNFNSVDVNMASPTFGTLTFNQYGGASFGGAFFAYDNPATTTTVETINFNTAFPSGMVLQLDSPDGIDSIIVEFTDNTGKKDKVKLTNITTFGRKYNFDGTEFDEIDITKIQTIAFVLEGEHVNQHLNVDWGNFAYIPSIANDPSNPSITAVPADSLGNRPTLTGFASTDNFNSAVVTPNSTNVGNIAFNLYGLNSFGGAFIAYDNAATTTTVETINLNTSFPAGIVLQLASADITNVILEVTDNTGKKDKVRLTGITASNKRYKILASDFDEVDVTKIQTFALVVEGQHIGQTLSYLWGDFDFIPTIANDPTNPAATPAPEDSLGNRPTLTGFASTDNFNSADVTMSSKSAGSVAFNLYGLNSFGGAFIAYDNAATTTTVETVNLSTAFPSGLVLKLSSSTITNVILEVTDSTGKRDKVRLSGITSSLQSYKILASDFDQVNTASIQTFAIVLEGQHIGETLNFVWGDFAYVPSITSDPTNPTITQLPNTSTGQPAELVGFASGGSSVNSNVVSTTEATLTFNLANATAFGGAFLNYDNLATTTTETIDLNSLFPSGIALEMDNAGTALSSIKVEVTDINGNRDSVRLVDILNTAKRWKIPVGEFDEVDTTKIKTIAFVLEGQASGLKLHLNWGLWQFVPEI